MKRGEKSIQIKPEYWGLFIGATILFLAQIIPEFNSFFWRSPTPALFFFGSFIWWMSKGIIPPVGASLFLLAAYIIGFPTLIAHVMKNTKGYSKWVVLTLGIAFFLGTFWVLGMSHLHQQAPEFDLNIPAH